MFPARSHAKKHSVRLQEYRKAVHCRFLLHSLLSPCLFRQAPFGQKKKG